MYPTFVQAAWGTSRILWDVLDTKKPLFSRAFGLSWIPEEWCLVEAAGIEPASANPLLSGLHVYPIFLFNCLTSDWKGVKTAIPIKFSSKI